MCLKCGNCLKIATIGHFVSINMNSKTWKIFQKHSKTGAIVCPFRWFLFKSVEEGAKNSHKTHCKCGKRGKRGRSESLLPLVYKDNTWFPHFHIYFPKLGASVVKSILHLYVEMKKVFNTNGFSRFSLFWKRGRFGRFLKSVVYQHLFKVYFHI